MTPLILCITAWICDVYLIISLMSTLLRFVRSEIHEKMRCSRCETHGGPQSTDAQSTAANESEEETSDIGGFAEIAGCLQNLKRSEKQVALCIFGYKVYVRYNLKCCVLLFWVGWTPQKISTG